LYSHYRTLLRPTDMQVGLQAAHLVEVSGENLVFGWVIVWLLHRSHGREAQRDRPGRNPPLGSQLPVGGKT